MFSPSLDYILVKPLPRLQSKVLEVVSHEKYGRGLVIAVGPGARIRNKRGEDTGKRRTLTVKPGDWITYGDGTLDYIYPKYFEAGIEYRILQEADVTFISERDFVDEHHLLSDAEVDSLLAEHNKPLEIRAVA